MKSLVDKGYRASPYDLTITNGEIHNILLSSREIKLVKIAATAYKWAMLNYYGRNIGPELDAQKKDLGHLGKHLGQYL